MATPSASVNTFVSAARNMYLLSSISLAAFVASRRDDDLAVIRHCALAVLLFSIWCGFTTCGMMERYMQKIQNSRDIMAHPATDFEAWQAYVRQVRWYSYLMVLTAAALVIVRRS